MVDPVEVAISVASGGASAYAVLRVTLARALKDIEAAFLHIHNINTRERTSGERIARLEARVDNLERK